MKKLSVILITIILAGCSSKPKSIADVGFEYLEKNDYLTAEKYFRQSANEGDSFGIIGLGAIAYKNKNIEKARNYFSQAANRGNSYGYFLLSKTYLNTTPKNCKLGLTHLISASWAGNNEAIKDLYNYFNTVTDNNVNYKDYIYGVNATILFNYNQYDTMSMANMINKSSFSPAEKERRYKHYLTHNDRVMASLLQKCENMDFKF